MCVCGLIIRRPLIRFRVFLLPLMFISRARHRSIWILFYLICLEEIWFFYTYMHFGQVCFCNNLNYMHSCSFIFHVKKIQFGGRHIHEEDEIFMWDGVKGCW